jgi:hypothetical protein
MTRPFSRRRTPRRLALEALESRALLAGDVSVDVVGGTLRLRGDEECNGVLIAQLGEGRYAVVGFEHDGAATTINGSAEPLVVRGVRHNFDIDLGGGDDLLGIGNDVELLAGLADELGFGDALLADAEVPELPDQRLRVPGTLIVRTKDGEDGVLVNASVRRSAIFRTGLKSDGVALVNSRFGDNVILRTETGQDGVLIENVTIDDHLNVHTGDNGDTLLVALSDIGHAVLNTGRGKDAVGISETRFDRHLVLLSGHDNDDVLLDVVAARRIHLDTGEGSDSVQIGGTEVDDLLAVFLGRGDDELAIAGASGRKALLRGGLGRDLVDASDLDFDRGADERQFEEEGDGAGGV